MPQLFTIIEEFEHEQHLLPDGPASQATLCEMLAYKVNKTEQLQQQWLERDVSRALHGPDPVAMEPLDDVLMCTPVRLTLCNLPPDLSLTAGRAFQQTHFSTIDHPS